MKFYLNKLRIKSNYCKFQSPKIRCQQNLSETSPIKLQVFTISLEYNKQAQSLRVDTIALIYCKLRCVVS